MSHKVQTAFRLDKDLLASLKIKAKASHRSLNNYIEHILYKDVNNIPNDLTKEAITEARTQELETIDDLDDFLSNS